MFDFRVQTGPVGRGTPDGEHHRFTPPFRRVSVRAARRYRKQIGTAGTGWTRA